VRKWAGWLAGAALVWSAASGAGAGAAGGYGADRGGDAGGKTRYLADVRVEPQQKRVTGSVQVQFWPRDGKKAYLHVYPFAFAERHDGPLWQEFLGKDAVPGTYHITRLSVQGRPVPVQRAGTVVEVPLEGGAVSSGVKGAPADGKGGADGVSRVPSASNGVPPAAGAAEPVTLELAFTMTLPLNQGRMSLDEHAIWLGNWLPVLAVCDRNGWHLDPYEPIGDPFYSETSDYSVNATVPEGYQLASTADDRQEAGFTSAPGLKTYRLRAENVRDFALVIMDRTYQRTETTVGGTTVRSWWRTTDDPGQARLVHDAAVKSFAYFQHQFGPYPYREYDVVRTGGGINGMEYPGLVFLDGRHYEQVFAQSIAAVAHETAHQWFYGIVGNDQVNEAWLDEGLTEYASLSFLERWYPPLGDALVVQRLVRGTAADAYAEKNVRPWQPLRLFPDNDSYSDLVYSRTASMLWLLREAWGEERLNRMLRQFVTSHRFGVATGADWKAALSREAGEDAEPFVAYWLQLDQSREAAAEAWLDRQRGAKRQ
jgi:hypothetical protein